MIKTSAHVCGGSIISGYFQVSKLALRAHEGKSLDVCSEMADSPSSWIYELLNSSKNGGRYSVCQDSVTSLMEW